MKDYRNQKRDEGKVSIAFGVSEEDAKAIETQWEGLKIASKGLALNPRFDGPFPKEVTIGIRTYPFYAVDCEVLKVVKARAFSPHFAVAAHSDIVPMLDGSPHLEVIHCPSGRGIIFVDSTKWKDEDISRLCAEMEGTQDLSEVRITCPVFSSEMSKRIRGFKPRLPGLKMPRRGEGQAFADDGCGYSGGAPLEEGEKRAPCASCGRVHGSPEASYVGLEAGEVGSPDSPEKDADSFVESIRARVRKGLAKGPVNDDMIVRMFGEFLAKGGGSKAGSGPLPSGAVGLGPNGLVSGDLGSIPNDVLADIVVTLMKEATKREAKANRRKRRAEDDDDDE